MKLTRKIGIASVVLALVWLGLGVLLGRYREGHQAEHPPISDIRSVISAEAAYAGSNGDFYGPLSCLEKPETCLPDYRGPRVPGCPHRLARSDEGVRAAIPSRAQPQRRGSGAGQDFTLEHPGIRLCRGSGEGRQDGGARVLWRRPRCDLLYEDRRDAGDQGRALSPGVRNSPVRNSTSHQAIPQLRPDDLP